MTPAPLSIPDEIHTPRLLLRRPGVQDAPEVYRAVQASLPELQQWMVWVHPPATLAETAENVQAAAERFEARTELRYHVWRVGQPGEAPELIGSSGFHALNWRVPKGEIGYWIATAHTGQGYATEVTHALTELALRPAEEGGLGFRRLEVRCDAANTRSARIPPALGYALEARLKHNERAVDGSDELRDTLIFSRTR